MDRTDKISKSLTKMVLILFVIFVIVGTLFSIYFITNLMPVNANSKDKVNFVIEEGWGQNKVINELKKENLIKNSLVVKIYIKLDNIDTFYKGTYTLSKSMSANEIMEVLTSGSSLENKEKTVTFVEGKRFPYYVKRMCEEFDFKEEDIYALTTDEEYLKTLIDKYWFINDDILNKDIYYPLEGYIFPDTYSFKESSTISDVLEILLNGMDKKLSVYKKDIEDSKYEIHGLLTLASMVELEAVTSEDRSLVAGVFYNRLDSNMPLGSDVTTYYAVKKEMTESLYNKDINICNAYNTRGSCAVSSLPIGPMCASSLSSLEAVIKPSKHDYYYFVADKNNKVYPSKNNNDQLKVINDLRSKGLWPE